VTFRPFLDWDLLRTSDSSRRCFGRGALTPGESRRLPLPTNSVPGSLIHIQLTFQTELFVTRRTHLLLS